MTSTAIPVLQPGVARHRAQAGADGATSRRLIGLVVAVAAAAILGVAAWLEPSPTGIGTHQQIFPMGVPCGWIALMDCPCPTCGMTTAFAHAANGNLLASFLAQPLGCLLALGTAMALLLGSFVAVTGSRAAGALSRLMTRSTAWALAAAVILAWGYKILSFKGVI